MELEQPKQIIKKTKKKIDSDVDKKHAAKKDNSYDNTDLETLLKPQNLTKKPRNKDVKVSNSKNNKKKHLNRKKKTKKKP